MIVSDPLFKEHVPGPSHPECPGRVEAIERGLKSFADFKRLDLRRATRAELLTVHLGDYLDNVKRLAAKQGRLGPDTPLCSSSHLVARFAVGSLVDLTDLVLTGKGPGFAAVRPPGHHAFPDRGMGFCLFNNVAVAAEAALRKVDRVAIVDVDVHHGNGTQKIFNDRREVLYASFHQHPFYPGTGGPDSVDGGNSSLLNLPLKAGAGWSELEDSWKQIVETLVDFEPGLTLVSAGFDAHREDPLGGLDLRDDDFLKVFCDLREVCGRSLVCVLEGGYNLEVLERLVPKVVDRITNE